jgi:hypothetical protein
MTPTHTPVNLIDNPIRCVERHKYAPELNVAYLTDWTAYDVPGACTIAEAEAYIQKHYA